jgi:eukaryotic-like serine/threonine-protein kinase
VPPATSTATASIATATNTATATSTPTPPTPTAPPPPLVFAAQVVEQPTDAAITCGTAFDSRIWGVVKDRSGQGIFGAGVEISSADGQHRYRATTNDQGGFELPGLGCTMWEVRLVDVPGAPGGHQAQALRVSLNGGQYSGAGVKFQQR